MVLTGNQIIERGIVTDMIDAKVQEQICGVDLTVKKIGMFLGRGTIDFDNSKRVLPEVEEARSWTTSKTGGLVYVLTPGCYLVTFNEVVHVPEDYRGTAKPRSSLLRMGCSMETSIWDPGYFGRSQSLLTVLNQHGVLVYQNARVAQIEFTKLDAEASKIYDGIYQRENISGHVIDPLK
jgi:dUTP pyrophosphatase